uniref:hypothetical protein n=1 Tax=Methylobacterium sp. B34 TaxID=95563 RepID=UPI0011AE54C8
MDRRDDARALHHRCKVRIGARHTGACVRPAPAYRIRAMTPTAALDTLLTALRDGLGARHVLMDPDA